MSDTKLTFTELLSVQGLDARLELARRQVHDDANKLWRGIETRLNLPSGAIGTTHRADFNPDVLAVVPIEAAKPPAEATTDAAPVAPKRKAGRPKKTKPVESTNGESAPAPEAELRAV